MTNITLQNSFYEKTARGRIMHLVDKGSFDEFLRPASTPTSPNLAALDIIGSFDDGVIIGRAKLDEQPVFVIAQEGEFMGGAVGEIHGAKIVGTLLKAIKDKPAAIIFLVDSGGVRLHEANAGLIAISEIMRAMIKVRNSEIPIITVIGGTCGAFGGMGISSCLSSYVVMTEEGRLGLSGPEVIETIKGVEEFDSKDRALVWRVTGGKTRYLLGHVDEIVEDDMADIRQAIINAMTTSSKPVELTYLQQNQAMLQSQQEEWFGFKDSVDIWRTLGIDNDQDIAMMGVDEVTALKQKRIS